MKYADFQKQAEAERPVGRKTAEELDMYRPLFIFKFNRSTYIQKMLRNFGWVGFTFDLLRIHLDHVLPNRAIADD